jgi:hypothetical protein
MNLLRTVSSLFLLLLGAIAIPVAYYCVGLAGFGTHAYNANSPIIAATVLAATTLLPAILIWIPHKSALFLGGFALALPTLISGLLLWAVPHAGVIGLIPSGLWYFSASKCWKQLADRKPGRRKRRA